MIVWNGMDLVKAALVTLIILGFVALVAYAEIRNKLAERKRKRKGKR